MVAVGDRSFVMADLPGLIEGAAEGKGRGLDFLRHAERSRVLVHILDISGGFAGEQDPWEGFLTINREMALYGAALERLPVLVVLNKIDVPAAQEHLPDVLRDLERAGYRYFPISAATGEGVDALLYAIDAILLQQEEAESKIEHVTPTRRVIVRSARRELEISLVDEGLWEVSGSGIERMLAMTDMESEESIHRLQTSLDRMGVFAALRERGIKEGDRVRIKGLMLEYTT